VNTNINSTFTVTAEFPSNAVLCGSVRKWTQPQQWFPWTDRYAESSVVQSRLLIDLMICFGDP